MVKDGKYSYVVVPGATKEAVKEYSKDIPVQIIQNDKKIQAVYHKKLNILQAVFRSCAVSVKSDNFGIFKCLCYRILSLLCTVANVIKFGVTAFGTFVGNCYAVSAIMAHQLVFCNTGADLWCVMCERDTAVWASHGRSAQGAGKKITVSTSVNK